MIKIHLFLFLSGFAALNNQAGAHFKPFMQLLRNEGLAKASEYYYEIKRANPDVILFREDSVNLYGYELLARQNK